jgi:hypothetical protein
VCSLLRHKTWLVCSTRCQQTMVCFKHYGKQFSKLTLHRRNLSALHGAVVTAMRSDRCCCCCQCRKLQTTFTFIQILNALHYERSVLCNQLVLGFTADCMDCIAMLQRRQGAKGAKISQTPLMYSLFSTGRYSKALKITPSTASNM